MEQPAFSIIVPTFERPARLARCLEALAHGKRPSGGFEVVVVDDGGREPLDPVIERFGGSLDLRLLRIENSGPGAARNAGARAARGRWLAFVDDDCVPEAGWLAALEEAAHGHPESLLGGSTSNASPESACARAGQVIAEVVHDHFNEPGPARFFPSNNLVAPREAFLALEGFDPAFRPASEDRDLCDRWLASGRDLVHVPAARVAHDHRQTLPGYLRQHFEYGRGAARFHRARAERGRGGLADAAGFHGEFLRGIGPRLAGQPGRLRLLALLVLWQLANAAGFAREELAFRVGSAGRGRAERDGV